MPTEPIRSTLRPARPARAGRTAPLLVEILHFAGCPNHEQAAEQVRRIAAELGLDVEITLVDVPDAEAADRRRFLGSPSVRIAGSDVEPEADERRDYAFSCRTYRTGDGLRGVPEEAWVRDGLLRARQ